MTKFDEKLQDLKNAIGYLEYCRDNGYLSEANALLVADCSEDLVEAVMELLKGAQA